jgi:hypothetical protein
VRLPQELATAIIEVIHAGVRVINLSFAINEASHEDIRRKPTSQ